MILYEAHLPSEVTGEIVAFAREHNVGRAILFGSRARGTNTDRSDIDIAVYGGDFESFYWDIKENTHTLLSFDVIDADSGISNDLTAEIENYGMILYEKA